MQTAESGKTVSMIWLILLFVLLLLLLILSMPIVVEAQLRIGVRGAVLRSRAWLLGLIPIPIRLRVHLLSEPYFTLVFGKKRVSLLQKNRNTGLGGILEGVRVLRLDTKTTVGIAGEPAQSVAVAGTIAVLLSMLIPCVAESGSAQAALSGSSMLRILVKTSALLFPLKTLFGFRRAKRIAKRKAANNIPESKEKRTIYAPG